MMGIGRSGFATLGCCLIASAVFAAGPRETEVGYAVSVVCERDHVTDAPMDRAGQVLVHLVDAVAEPVPEVPVVLFNRVTSRQAVSDVRGRVHFHDLKDGSYTVKVRVPGFYEASTPSFRVRRSCLSAVTMPLRVVDVTN
jgi:hypothetical protein